MEGAAHPAVRFADLVSGPPPRLELDHACALMAAAFTGVDRTVQVRNELDALASGVTQPSLEGVLGAMYGNLTGNREHYYDPRNSFIDEVLRRGVGLPITLSVIAIEVGRRVGAPLVGVGLPGHFLVREQGRDVYGDPFHDGMRYDRAGVVSAWERLVGDGTPFDELHLTPVSERTILIRMLNNLRALYLPKNEANSSYALAIMRGGFSELAHESPQHARWVRSLN
jgi:regulator of sirC expression with transglutaminase-like and TPR domain